MDPYRSTALGLGTSALADTSTTESQLKTNSINCVLPSFTASVTPQLAQNPAVDREEAHVWVFNAGAHHYILISQLLLPEQFCQSGWLRLQRESSRPHTVLNPTTAPHSSDPLCCNSVNNTNSPSFMRKSSLWVFFFFWAYICFIYYSFLFR